MMKTLKFIVPAMLLAFTATAQQKPAPKQKASTAESKTSAAAATVLTGTPTDDFFEHYVLKHTDEPAPEGYGTTPAHPIPVGVYETYMGNEKKMNEIVIRFLKSYLWADNTPVVYIDRTARMINNVNYDLFRVTKVGSKDTLTLYTDMYKSAPIQLIKGFKFYTKEQLFTELAPDLEMIKKYDATPNKYDDAGAKAASFKILGALQADVGLDYLMDQEYISPVLNDVGIDLDLKAFLIRSYIFHKFAFQLTGNANPQVTAYNFMVDEYQTVIKSHDIFSKGQLAQYMIKK